MVPWAVVILPALALLPLSVVISSKFKALNFSVQRSDYLGILLLGYFIIGFTDSGILTMILRKISQIPKIQ